MDAEELFDIIELDRMTGNDRVLWMHIGVTRRAAEEAVEWLEKNITNRYGYEIVTTWLHAGDLEVDGVVDGISLYPEGTVHFKGVRDQRVPAKRWMNNQWVGAQTDQPFSKIAQQAMEAAYDAWVLKQQKGS